MPDEAADPAEPADPAARFERSRKEFAEDLTVLLIKCGNPTQKSLVDAAAKHAAKKQNDKFRLNPSTLSAVLHGHVFPGNEFLSALIMQLVQVRPEVGDYKKLWKEWEEKWQKLAFQKKQAAAYLKKQKREADQAAAKLQQQRERAEDLVSAAHREADALVAGARADVVERLLDARDRSADITAMAKDDAAALHATQARQLALETAEAEQQLQTQRDESARQILHEAQQTSILRLRAQVELQQAQTQAKLMRAEAARESEEARERCDEEIRQARGEAEVEVAQMLESARQTLERARRQASSTRLGFPLPRTGKAGPLPTKADGEQPDPRAKECTLYARLMASAQPFWEGGGQLAVQTGKQLEVRPVYDIEPAWTPAVWFGAQKRTMGQTAPDQPVVASFRAAASQSAPTQAPPQDVTSQGVQPLPAEGAATHTAPAASERAASSSPTAEQPLPAQQIPLTQLMGGWDALYAERNAAKEPEPLDDPRRLLVWPAPDVGTQQALSDRGYRPVIVRSSEEVDAQIAAFPAALFVDPLTGPITRTALQSLRTAAVAAEIPVLVTAGLGQTTRENPVGADPAVLLKALAPRDSEQHPPRVLLIEEHAEIALALTSTMERRGMQVARAASDADAVTLAGQLRPNLVVMDLMQVRLHQAGILDWLRANGQLKRTPLVVYTAAVDLADLPRLASGETVLFLAERATSPEVQIRIVDALAKISTC